MDNVSPLVSTLAPWLVLSPACLMAAAATWAWGRSRRAAVHAAAPWPVLMALSWTALAAAVFAAALQAWLPANLFTWKALGLGSAPLAAVLAVLVQFLGTVIVGFSARYLHGEPGQFRALAALAAVLAAVQLLLLADHWLWLWVAWSAVGWALQPLLCFYPDRPFALLAAHKKRLADRLADGLIMASAALAWWTVGSGSLTDLWQHLATQGASPALHASAVLLVLAVGLRTALLPVHGWLIQVMEAPTPVSALLHAGVVNLGGFVLIRFAPLLEASAPARWLLVALGLATAVLAGLVMLTRISIKVRLAWSTVAQMGFMVLECGLGLYTLAALHLIGHSLYKAHAFLAASSVVRESRQQLLRGQSLPATVSVWLAPILAGVVVAVLVAVADRALGLSAWPWWWSGVLALAWAPLLWWAADGGQARLVRVVAGMGWVIALTVLAVAAHGLGFGLRDRPDHAAGALVWIGLAGMYLVMVTRHASGDLMDGWRRWSYAGFYVDEFYTRLALRFWPTTWGVGTPRQGSAPAHPLSATFH